MLRILGGRMKWSIIVHVFSLLSCGITLSLGISLSRPNCQEKCGDITIPFPFGISSKCSANASFTVICRNSTTPFLSSINMEALNISILGTVVVKQPVSAMNCSAKLSTGHLPISLKGTPFTISARYNTLAVSGCKNSVWLLANETTTVGGCTSMCDANSTETSCNGVNCCQTTLPPQLKELQYNYKTIEASNMNDSSCGYVIPIEKIWLSNDYKSFKGGKFGFAPLVLDWEFGEVTGYSNSVCKYSDDYCLSYPNELGRREVTNRGQACMLKHLEKECDLYPTNYRACKSLSDPTVSHSIGNIYSFDIYYYEDAFSVYYDGYDYVSSTKYCSCPRGYEGNPYLPEKCIDINECSNATQNPCGPSWSCINVKGDYTCKDRNAKNRTRLKIAFISIGSGLGALVLLLIAWRSTKAIRRRIKANRRRKFFKRNGGLLLEQQLTATDNGLDKTRLYSSKELTLATDRYNENRILGRGGQGTVYKGMLKDGKIVAVKKSQEVEEGDLDVFINEVVILSQVNHRNVVKLLGCCLETEVPLLVYEFIPNGTLFQHIHEPNEEFPLTWEMRVRIAREVAGSLAYLHSAASAPIYHRDIKSTNILLDDKYRPKVSDFGTSRSVALDQTHCTTRVLGTFGYLDPEYFQSNRFTEKSDVYSFGVVMVELLTGEKAISSIRAEAGRSLATHFLHSMEENQLFEILDARVLREGKMEEIMAVAHLARRCLHLNGKRRPTMKAVAAELEAITEVEEWSYAQRDGGGGTRETHSIEVFAESHSFSSIAPFSLEAEYPLHGE
ncbi:wall-associated receptor kinase-like 6 [Salvia miltiorrhiza]|uniref:wall-associated receptor kinase-like 6 n=1 Tax=Salvia miltiorrhiza TaxID=226208 RepID=UPI0025AD8900|nr:wall-associated receptor kinase-like 6 [Salvia miltiorrhiza]XP_057765852.1 wall-associated receptor kinase-like 6 [Salvia miltiorrhiza]XP_057765853.1 wall-associated receptor kinase-like 6 [Salvia miltiorrhiza]